jgi:riboflavin synthase alpha subunit
MFTGIITDIGTVRAIRQAGDTRFEIATAYDLWRASTWAPPSPATAAASP